MKNKRILFFVSGSYVGGLETMAFNLAKQLKHEGHHVYCIINGWNNGVFKSMLSSENIDFSEVKLGWLHLRKPLWTLDTLINLPKAYFKSRQVLKTFKPDILHFHNFSNYLFLYPLISIRSIYTLHETHYPSKKLNVIYKLLNKKINCFVGVSNFIGDCLKNLPVSDSKVKVIYNGIETEKLNRNKRKNNIFTIGIVGHIENQKGHEILIEASSILLKKKYDFRIKIFGKALGEYDKILKKIIIENGLINIFEWVGFESEKHKIYSQVDIVVVPTVEKEALSITKMEAMYYHCPVIVSDVGGNPELVVNDVTGLVFPTKDSTALAEKIEFFLKQPEKITEMGDSAYNFIKEYNVSKMTKEYVKLYEDSI